MPTPPTPPNPDLPIPEGDPSAGGFLKWLMEMMGYGIDKGTEFARSDVTLPTSQFAGNETTPPPTSFPPPNLDKFGAQPNPNQPRQQFPIPDAMLRSMTSRTQRELEMASGGLGKYNRVPQMPPAPKPQDKGFSPNPRIKRQAPSAPPEELSRLFKQGQYGDKFKASKKPPISRGGPQEF